jgi:short-subunit dehydrogenase
MPNIDLAGKPIAITGASSGIGRATALAAARAGMPVILGARRLEKLREVEEQIRAQGGRAVAHAVDVDHAESSAEFVRRGIEAFGGLYSVFANAGYGLEGPVQHLTDEQLRAIIQTNFWGTLNVIRPSLPHFLERRQGHVLICSSCVSKVGLPLHSAYSLTKAMQDHVGRAMRIELLGTGVHVSTVHPIGTRTEFSERTADRSGGARQAVRTPDSMMQSPEFVADRIIACLRRPVGEVWTSTKMRLSLGLLTAFPSLGDWYLARRLRRSAEQE